MERLSVQELGEANDKYAVETVEILAHPERVDKIKQRETARRFNKL
ncbi:MAG: hypothetical protein MJ081_05830 [Ruminococcus sp.]|nr:hypothetical protein [Ruminococcus sp.]